MKRLYNKGNYKQNLGRMVLVHSTKKGVCEELCINKNKARRKMGNGHAKKIPREEMLGSQKHIKRCFALVVMKET